MIPNTYHNHTGFVGQSGSWIINDPQALILYTAFQMLINENQFPQRPRRTSVHFLNHEPLFDQSRQVSWFLGCVWFVFILSFIFHFHQDNSCNLTPLNLLSVLLSVRPSVRQNHRLAQRAIQPSAGARKKPPVGGLNFLVKDNLRTAI